MKRRVMTALAAALIVLPFPTAWGRDDATGNAVREEWKRLEGTWEAVAGTRDGEKVVFPADKKMLLTISPDGSYSVKLGRETMSRGRWALGPTQRPRAVDDTTDRGKTVFGIYEVRGDELRLCQVPPSRGRPTDFTSGRGSERYLTVFRRVKPKP